MRYISLRFVDMHRPGDDITDAYDSETLEHMRSAGMVRIENMDAAIQVIAPSKEIYPVVVSDDLTVIPGIGKKISVELNNLGIYSLHALIDADAGWLDAQIARSHEQIQGWQMKAREIVG